jgi:hypothetical protein
LTRLRQLAPKRALTFSESLTVAIRQTTHLRELLGITAVAMPLDWVPELPKVTVEVVPAYRLDEGTSGLTKRENGRYLIAINKNRARSHRRFTLATNSNTSLTTPTRAFGTLDSVLTIPTTKTDASSASPTTLPPISSCRRPS